MAPTQLKPHQFGCANVALVVRFSWEEGEADWKISKAAEGFHMLRQHLQEVSVEQDKTDTLYQRGHGSTADSCNDTAVREDFQTSVLLLQQNIYPSSGHVAFETARYVCQICNNREGL